jgi:hypothetical protein
VVDRIRRIVSAVLQRRTAIRPDVRLTVSGDVRVPEASMPTVRDAAATWKRVAVTMRTGREP